MKLQGYCSIEERSGLATKLGSAAAVLGLLGGLFFFVQHSGRGKLVDSRNHKGTDDVLVGNGSGPPNQNQCCKPERRWGCACSFSCGLGEELICPSPDGPEETVDLGCSSAACQNLPESPLYSICVVKADQRKANYCVLFGEIGPCKRDPVLCPATEDAPLQCVFVEYKWNMPTNPNVVLVSVCDIFSTLCPVNYQVCD